MSIQKNGKDSCRRKIYMGGGSREEAIEMSKQVKTDRMWRGLIRAEVGICFYFVL